MKTQILVVLLVCPLAVVGPAQAQTSENGRTHRFWIGYGLGLGSSVPADSKIGLAEHLHAGYQYGRNVLSSRFVAVSPPETRDFTDVSVLYGYVLTSPESENMFSVGAGGAYVVRTSHEKFLGTPDDAVPGLALEVQYYVREFPSFLPGGLEWVLENLPIARVGVSAFMNVSSRRNFWGATAGIQLGKFW